MLMIKKWMDKHPDFVQFVKYALFSGFASVVEFSVFAVMNFLVFAKLKGVDFVWWILHYEADTGGGLGGFLSIICAYCAAQVFNFFIQRKKTFHSDNDPVRSGILYAIMVIAVWVFQVWFCGVLMTAFREPLGRTFGDILAECINMALSFWIQYPINKYVIMRRSAKD